MAVSQRLDDGILHGGSQVGEVVFDEMLVFLEAVAHEVEEGGLEPAEAVVEVGDMGDGKAEPLRVAGLRQLVDDGAAGVGEPQNFRRFVESLARRVVNCAPDDLHVEIVIHLQQKGMASRNRQAQKGKVRFFLFFSLFLQKICQNMRLKMVHFNERNPQTEGHRL